MPVAIPIRMKGIGVVAGIFCIVQFLIPVKLHGSAMGALQAYSIQ